MQGHPEFSSEYTNALISNRVDRIGKSVVEAAQESLNSDVDSNLVASWMVAFIKNARDL